MLPLEFGVTIDIHTHEISEVPFKTTRNPQMMYLGTPNCKYMQNIFVHLIPLNLQAKSAIQTISYQFKMSCGSTKETQMLLARVANLVANSDNTAYVVERNGPLGTNFSEILIKIHIFSLMKMHLKISSVKHNHFVQGVMS